MVNLAVIIVTAIVAFSATNIDDICLLIVYFARAKSGQEMTSMNVWIGQTLGFTVICALSLLGIVLGLFLPSKY